MILFAGTCSVYSVIRRGDGGGGGGGGVCVGGPSKIVSNI